MTDEAVYEAPSLGAIDSILGALEKVFAGDSEFEDAFEALNVHTARARRLYPHLYQVLRNPPGMQNSILAALDGGSLHDVSDAVSQLLDMKLTPLVPLLVTSIVTALPKPQVIQMQAPQYQPPLQSMVGEGAVAGGAAIQGFPEPNPEANAGGLRIYDYQPWQQQLAASSQLGQKWAIRWDNGAPMKPVGETLTIKTAGGRMRFAIKDQIDEKVQVWEFVKLLPYERG